MIRISRHVRRAWGLLCLVLVAAVAPNVVLCEGRGGHVSVESVLATVECCAAPATSAQDGPVLSHASGPCGSCTDTWLLVATGMRDVPAPQPAVLVAAAPAPLPSRSIAASAFDARAHVPGRGSAASTVLLI